MIKRGEGIIRKLIGQSGRKPNKGKGNRFKGCKTLRDAYKYYKAEQKAQYLKPVDYKTYSSLVKECNKTIVDYVLSSGDNFILPLQMGSICIKKRVRTYNEKNRNKWAVDYKKSKELGFIVYFTTEFNYKWTWKKRGANFQNKGIFVFIACRTAKRGIAKSINGENKDYYF